MDPQARPLFDDDADFDEVQEALAVFQQSDGLPQVMPTAGRLNEMLAGVSDPDNSLGQLPPLFGELTPRAVAYQCVLAGCRPTEFPLVFSAAAATLDPSFNLLGILTTTGTVCVAMAVHGPIAKSLGIGSSTNCLGPGNRANACIGRALSLVMRNVGGAREGVGDMATMGQPGKYTFCFAEDAHDIFPTLHQRRNFAPGDNAVSVLGVSGTLEVLPAGNGDSPEAILTPVARAMRTAYAVSGAARKDLPSEQVLLLPPELATFITGKGWDLNQVQTFLYTALTHAESADAALPNAAENAESIHIFVTGGPGVKMTYLPLWGGGTRVITRALHIFG